MTLSAEINISSLPKTEPLQNLHALILAIVHNHVLKPTPMVTLPLQVPVLHLYIKKDLESIDEPDLPSIHRHINNG